MTKERIPNQPKRDHRVVVADFFGKGENLEAWQLGWTLQNRVEVKSAVSKKIFDYYVTDMGMNMIFYYVEDGNFYGIHGEECPTPVFRFKKEPADYIEGEIGDRDTHSYQTEEILYMVDCDKDDLWDTVKIDGKSLEEVIQNSYIVVIN